MSYMQTLVVYLILFLSLAYALNKSEYAPSPSSISDPPTTRAPQ